MERQIKIRKENIMTYKLSTRKIVIAGVLSGVIYILGATQWGFISFSWLAGSPSASIMHIPVIIGAVLKDLSSASSSVFFSDCSA